MARTVGINLGIDLSKVDKDKLIKKNGKKYLNLSTFVNLDEVGQYGDNGGITIQQTQAERESGAKREYVGNSKIFWSQDIDVVTGNRSQDQETQQHSDSLNEMTDDPF